VSTSATTKLDSTRRGGEAGDVDRITSGKPADCIVVKARLAAGERPARTGIDLDGIKPRELAANAGEGTGTVAGGQFEHIRRLKRLGYDTANEHRTRIDDEAAFLIIIAQQYRRAAAANDGAGVDHRGATPTNNIDAEARRAVDRPGVHDRAL
jgi:hypothetical protein